MFTPSPPLDTRRAARYVHGVGPAYRRSLRTALVAFLATSWATPTLGQTLGDLEGGEECTTIGTEGISAQLTRFHECEFAASLSRLGDVPGVELASERTHDLVTTETRSAVAAAAATVGLRISVAYRPLSEQYVIYKTPACAIFDEPGSDSHQSGTAIDVQNWEEARDALIASGCTQPQPEALPVHFECGGMDMRGNAVLSFQTLWNINRPDDLIAEDGDYGPQTEARLRMTPATGFSDPGCEPRDAGMGTDAGIGTDAGVPPFEDDACSASNRPPKSWLFAAFALAGLARRRRA